MASISSSVSPAEIHRLKPSPSSSGTPEGRVAGAAEAAGRLDEPLEHGVGAQVAGDAEERLAHRGQRRRPISHRDRQSPGLSLSPPSPIWRYRS